MLSECPCSSNKSHNNDKKKKFYFDDVNRCIATKHNVTGNEAIQDVPPDSRDSLLLHKACNCSPSRAQQKLQRPHFPYSFRQHAFVPNNLPDPKVFLYMHYTVLYIDNTLEQIGRIGRALSLSIDT
jgi:hypothetical protein